MIPTMATQLTKKQKRETLETLDSMVWRIGLKFIRDYLDEFDMIFLMFTSKAFLMEHYREYRGNLIYDLYDYHEDSWFYDFNVRNFLRRNVADRPKWFLKTILETDVAYIIDDGRVYNYWHRMPVNAIVHEYILGTPSDHEPPSDYYDDDSDND